MMNGEKIMSEYVWCHGPNCHTNHTVDRVRGSKGAKVLRTRKIKFYESRYNNFIIIFVVMVAIMILHINTQNK
jgi:hypothetical protein